MAQILTADEVRAYLSDYAESNLLLDKEDFKDPFIKLCMDLGADEFNQIPPRSGYSAGSFPSKSLLLQGTLWHMFQGRAALAVRNTLSYTDGGLTIPIEEKYELYSAMAATYKANFMEAATKLKINMNMESGWGEIRSDEANFPIW